MATGIPKSGVSKPSVLTLVESLAIFPLVPNKLMLLGFILWPLYIVLLPSYIGPTRTQAQSSAALEKGTISRRLENQMSTAKFLRGAEPQGLDSYIYHRLKHACIGIYSSKLKFYR